MSIEELIQKRRRDIHLQISTLQRELARCDAAYCALRGTAMPQQSGGDSQDMPQGLEGVTSAPGMDGAGFEVPDLKMSIKEMVVEVLQANPQGLKALALIRAIAQRYGKTIPRPSLSPQLSRLKAQGTVIRDGRLWRLVVTGVTAQSVVDSILAPSEPPVARGEDESQDEASQDAQAQVPSQELSPADSPKEEDLEEEDSEEEPFYPNPFDEDEAAIAPLRPGQGR